MVIFETKATTLSFSISLLPIIILYHNSNWWSSQLVLCLPIKNLKKLKIFHSDNFDSWSFTLKWQLQNAELTGNALFPYLRSTKMAYFRRKHQSRVLLLQYSSSRPRFPLSLIVGFVWKIRTHIRVSVYEECLFSGIRLESSGGK